MCLQGNLGAAVHLDGAGRAETAHFGEGGGRIVLELAPGDEVALCDLAARHSAPCERLGHVTDDSMLRIVGRSARSAEDQLIALAVAALREPWEGAITWAMR
jgi:hypothetical protein